MLPLPWSPPNANRKHSNGLQSVRLGAEAIITRASSARRATTIYDGPGVHDDLISMTVLLMNVLMVVVVVVVLLLLLVMRQMTKMM